MKTHLKDLEIQLLVENNGDLFAKQAKHLLDCTDCKLKYDNYAVLFNSLKEMPSPIIAESFADVVLNAVEDRQPKMNALQPKIFYSLIIITVLILLLAILPTTQQVHPDKFEEFVMLMGFLGFVFIFLNEYSKLFKRKNYFEGFSI